MDAAARLNLPWFESPFFARELERAELDDQMRERVRSYAERGYVVLDLDRLDPAPLHGRGLDRARGRRPDQRPASLLSRQPPAAGVRAPRPRPRRELLREPRRAIRRLQRVRRRSPRRGGAAEGDAVVEARP